MFSPVITSIACRLNNALNYIQQLIQRTVGTRRLLALLKNYVTLTKRKGHNKIEMDGGNPSVSFQ